jgi:hypothetical protein
MAPKISCKKRLSMRVVKSIFKWSLYTATFAATMVVGGVAAVFASVEMLSFIVGISA